MLSRQGPVANHRIEEPTVRHAAIPVHLIEQVRAAGQPGRRQPSAAVDAPPDPTPAPTRRLVRFVASAQRLARLAHRGRARTPGLRAGSPGGGA